MVEAGGVLTGASSAQADVVEHVEIGARRALDHDAHRSSNLDHSIEKSPGCSDKSLCTLDHTGMLMRRDRHWRANGGACPSGSRRSAGPAIAGTDAPVTGKSAMVVRLLRQLVAVAGAGARIPSERDLARTGVSPA